MVDIIVAVIVGAAVVGIIWKKVKDTRSGNGGSGCGCGCSGCSAKDKCH